MFEGPSVNLVSGPTNHLDFPFSVLSRNPQLSVSWVSVVHRLPCSHRGTLPDTMGQRQKRSAGRRQAVSSRSRQPSSSETPSLLPLPPYPQWGSKCRLDLGGLTAAARARRCCRSASRARACQGRGRGPVLPLWVPFLALGTQLPPAIAGGEHNLARSLFFYA